MDLHAQGFLIWRGGWLVRPQSRTSANLGRGHVFLGFTERSRDGYRGALYALWNIHVRWSACAGRGGVGGRMEAGRRGGVGGCAGICGEGGARVLRGWLETEKWAGCAGGAGDART